MKQSKFLILIDSDVRRRAAISHALAGIGIHVEPFESIDEFEMLSPRSGAILIGDDGANIETLLDSMANSDECMPVIGFSDHLSADRIVRAIQAGAVNYLQWPCDAAAIAGALVVGEAKAATASSQKRREATARRRVEQLTPRERQVLTAITKGLSNRSIGQHLAISPRTVEIHRANLINKLGASNTSEAIRIGLEASLVSGDRRPNVWEDMGRGHAEERLHLVG